MSQKKKALVLVYNGMSLSEISLLTASLTVSQPIEDSWVIDTVGSNELKMVTTEDGFQVMPNKVFSGIDFSGYELVVLTGIINPYPIVEDQDLIAFLGLLNEMPKRPLIASISSSPMLLAKSGILDKVKFTSGLFEETLDEFDYLHKENIIRQPVVYDEEYRVVTGIGFAYREFAVKVAELMGHDDAKRRLAGVRQDRSYTEEELTFYRDR